jgi:hypothetical protein
MADTYVDLISNLQKQGLNAVKQAQDVQLAALNSLRDVAAQLASAPFPTAENVPTPAKIVELNANFASAFVEQQKAFALQLAGFFEDARKDISSQAARFTKAVQVQG